MDKAIKNIGVDVVRSGARGGITGALSSAFRIGGRKIPLLKDASCATVMAASVVDGGVAVYEYARGEIDAKQLVEQLQDTTIKSATTIYFTKAATYMFGATNPFIPIAIYSVANYVIASTREIIRNAKLNAEEHDRLTKLNDEMTKEIEKFHVQLILQMEKYEIQQNNCCRNC